jgi:hypothetical protein
MRRVVLGLASCALLAACGGGGTNSGSVPVVSGGIGNTPTPSPTPTPTPTPTVGGLKTGEIKPTADASFIAATLEMTTTGETNALTGQTAGGTTSERSAFLDTPGFSGSYNTTGYHLADSVNSSAFGQAQLTSDTTGGNAPNPTVLFTNITSLAHDYLALYKESVTTTSILGSGVVAPKYGGVGSWQHTVVNGASRRTRLDYFGFGPATPAGSMPHSGVVKFSVMGSGNYARDTDLYFTNQYDEVDVDFGTGIVTGTTSATGDNFYSDETGGLYGVSWSGTIVGNTAAGATSSSVAIASGQFRVFFVGPHADEMIVIHEGQDGRGTYVGSAIGVRNPYLP